MKRTKIVCTLGPATHTEEKLIALVKAGMNVCRLNFSHGTHEDHAELIKLIRAVSKKTGEPLTILQDLQGPKIRVGALPEKGILLEAGKEVIFTTSEKLTGKKIPVTYPALHKDVKAGQTMLLDDGLLAVRVLKIRGQDVVTEVVTGGLLTSHKGLNLPETKTTISAMSDKDRDDVVFGVAQHVDWIALSFVRSAADVHELRELVESEEAKLPHKLQMPIRLLAKIEKPEAVACLDEIVEAVDGIMVARGDLGVEMPAAKVPVIQKDLIHRCLHAAKPVIVATQMLDSMIRNPRATRAEISDIANAVIDHTDATMLSGETASGAYPVEAVQAMADTIHEVEASPLDDVSPVVETNQQSQLAMTNISTVLVHASQAKAIVVATLSGRAAQYISRYRPELPIFAMTPHERVVRQLNLSWGVQPFHIPERHTMPTLIEASLKTLVQNKMLKKGDQVILIAGEPLGESGHVNMVELCQVS
ncbi:pyruvate kinase [Patescibacteria group bacterium]|nr:pyruvate kinase [Patescibacteria group bacterium]